jgi:hypothetical protein
MQIIPDHLVLYLQLKVLGTLFSAIAYGIVAVSLGKLLVSPPEKTGNPIISHVDSPPHLRYSHAPPQHLHVIPIHLSSCWVHVPTRNTTRWPHVSSDYTYSHHLGRKWVHGENYNPPVGNTGSQCFRFGIVSSRIRTRLINPGFS